MTTTTTEGAMDTVTKTRPPLPRPMYKREGRGAWCLICNHYLRGVHACAYYAHGKSAKHRDRLSRYAAPEAR